MIAEVVSVLRRAAVEVRVIPTESPASAGSQAYAAMEEGCDTILVCGGDGTVHESLQQLVGGKAALGVIPMGTANALATDLGLPGSPIRAVKKLLGRCSTKTAKARHARDTLLWRREWERTRCLWGG